MLTLTSCAQSELHVQAADASGVAAVANISLDMLGKAFEADLQAAIDEDASAAAQHRSPNRARAMDAAQATVEKRWIPIWGDRRRDEPRRVGNVSRDALEVGQPDRGGPREEPARPARQRRLL